LGFYAFVWHVTSFRTAEITVNAFTCVRSCVVPYPKPLKGISLLWHEATAPKACAKRGSEAKTSDIRKCIWEHHIWRRVRSSNTGINDPELLIRNKGKYGQDWISCRILAIFSDQDWIFIFEKIWIRTGSGCLFDFYNKISLRAIQDVTNEIGSRVAKLAFFKGKFQKFGLFQSGLAWTIVVWHVRHSFLACLIVLAWKNISWHL